jgi:DNA-binding NarL/FixJ family response regulator
VINIVIIEDDKVISKSLNTLLNIQPEMMVVGSFGSIEDIGTTGKEESIMPNVILLDIILPGKSGIQGIKYIKELLSLIHI